jgi:hypothetical protein
MTYNSHAIDDRVGARRALMIDRISAGILRYAEIDGRMSLQRGQRQNRKRLMGPQRGPTYQPRAEPVAGGALG